MSGGSFGYLYSQDPYSIECLEDMRDELRRRGMTEAAKETAELIPKRASQELADLWRAIEWEMSNDTSQADTARVFIKYEQAKIREMNPPG